MQMMPSWRTQISGFVVAQPVFFSPPGRFSVSKCEPVDADQQISAGKADTHLHDYL